MDTIDARLRELEQVESGLFSEHQDFLRRRAQEDEITRTARVKEDEEWKQRLAGRDREEDVGRS